MVFWHIDGININIFMTDITTGINNIFFIRSDNHQFKLAKKSTQRTKFFIDFFANLDR